MNRINTKVASFNIISVTLLIHMIQIPIFVLLLIFLSTPVKAHDWYPIDCCSDKDCMPINPADLVATPKGWKIMTSGEIVPYDSHKIRKIPMSAPPEAFTNPHVCFRNGDIKAESICVYPMNQGT